ncbi:MAG TPA: type IV pilus twitching motility protein PilT [Gemmatimonadaceae bacterium]|nr:type IV pilus twitching motility protein PilT [Gemmatimonadaceae bacterium]
MPQLDRLLSVMVSQRATALKLHESELAELEIAGAPRPMTKTALTSQQVVSLLREIAPADAAAHLDAGRPTQFDYVSEDGAFCIDAAREGTQWRARVTLDERRERQRLNGHPRPEIPEYAASMPAAAPAAPAGAPAAAPAAVEASVAALPTVGGDADAINAFPGSDRAKAALDALLRTMVERGSSDLHLRCGEPPIVRLHGEMTRLEGGVLEPTQLDAMIRSIMPERNRREYTDSNDTDYAYELAGVARFRANALKDRKGPAAVFRQIPATVVTVEQMGITPEVQKLCQLNKGLVLVTGPTGSGKSTTLCSLIDLVNRSRSDHVLTIEDPIEFVHPNKKCVITQRQVGVHTGSFKSALRAALREDPDIILVGELRDLETVAIAIETAETGHLVFGTLHTTTAAGTIDRIIDQFPADRQSQIRVMLAESLKGVISQTLCKKIGGGRVAAREVLLSIPAVTNLIREGKTFQIPTVMQTSKRLGMVTLNDALMELVDGKLIEPAEGYGKAVDKVMYVNSLRSRGLDTSFAESDPGIAKDAAKEPPKPAAAAPAKR